MRTFSHRITLSGRFWVPILALAGWIGACRTPDSETPASGSESTRAITATASTLPPDSVRVSVVRAVASIDAMRSGLATTFDPSQEVTRETFARVCKPVGQRAAATAQERGWVVQQLARKNRNPAHALDSLATVAHNRFAADPDTTSIWRRTTMKGQAGWRYFRRITVEPSCLACHGPKDERPAFIVDGYPDDRAYGFDAGDLRGLYAVFVPDAG